jgi:hypothetical protein
MGDYTRLKVDAVLKRTTPADVIAVLEDVAEGREHSTSRGQEHEWFKFDHWNWMPTSCSGLGYFPEAIGEASLERLDDGRFRWTSHSSFKNYDRRAEAFLSWLAPHLDADPGDVVGEAEFDGFFGRQLSNLVARPDRIDKVAVPDEGESGPATGYF